MKNLAWLFSVTALSALVGGCWTFQETPEHDIPELVRCPADRTITVAVNGFKATEIDYYAVYGYQTYHTPGGYGPHHYYPGYSMTVPTTTYIPQVRPDESFLVRARDAFETAGFVIMAEKPDWTMEVVFDGPINRPEDDTSRICWPLFTAFLTDFEANEWCAKLRLRDNRTGKIVFGRDYVERYETKAFSPLPLIGIVHCEKVRRVYGKTRCLSVLTERVLADATAELVRLSR